MTSGIARAFARDGTRGASTTTTVAAPGCAPEALWRLLATASREVLDDPTAVRRRMTLDGAAGHVAGGALLAAYQPLAHLALRRLVAIARATTT